MAGTRFQFGSGTLYGIPNGGNLSSGALSGAGTTPRKFGTLQGVEIDFAITQKDLIGQNLFPDDVAVASIKITGKAKIGQVDTRIFNDLVFGQVMTAGLKDANTEATDTVPTTPFQVTAAPPASGIYVSDLGVFDNNLGDYLVQVASGPTTGQYSVTIATGIYLFAAADSGHVIQISYVYSVAASGSHLAVTNQPQGYSPVFQVVLKQSYEAKDLTLVLYQCKAAKLTLPTKAAEYVIPELDFAAYQNASGQVFDWYQS